MDMQADRRVARWLVTPKVRSLVVNGDLVRSLRQQLALTQHDLARAAGYSERLIRKAEASGGLQADTIEVLATALSTMDQRIYPEDLISFPEELARKLVRAYASSQTEFAGQLGELCDPEVSGWCAGDPAAFPFAGPFVGIQGFAEFWHSFFSHYRRTANSPFAPSFLVEQNEVIAIGQDQWHIAATDVTTDIWLVLRMTFQRGKLARFEFFFDTLGGSRSNLPNAASDQGATPGGE
jgi:transcriptional regulator with XRE-family HTH domain